jgi:WD40 repeat protein
MAWETATGASINHFQFPANLKAIAAFSRDCKLAVTTCTTQGAHLWNLAAKKRVRLFSFAPAEAVGRLEISRDGKRLTAVINSGNRSGIGEWSIADGKAFSSSWPPEDRAWYLASSPDGTRIVTVDVDKGAVVLWDKTTNKALHTLPAKGLLVGCASFSHDGQYLALGFCDGKVLIWDTASGKDVQSLSGLGGDVVSVAFTANGRRLLTAFSNESAVLWDIATAAQHRVFRQEKLAYACLHPSEHYVLTGLADGRAILWEIRSAKPAHAFEWKGPPGIRPASWSADGRRLLLGLSVYDIGSRFERSLTPPDLESAQRIHASALSPDGQCMVTAQSFDRGVRLWDMTTGKHLGRLATFAGGEEWLVVTPDGLYDGREGGRQMLSYRIDGKTLLDSADQHRELHRPGLLADIFAGKRPKLALRASVGSTSDRPKQPRRCAQRTPVRHTEVLSTHSVGSTDDGSAPHRARMWPRSRSKLS